MKAGLCNLCDQCDVLKEIFQSAVRNGYQNYFSVLADIQEMVGQGSIELFAGDCPVAEVEKHLAEEIHYTVCHYFRCKSCNRYFFIGACIRGKPVYKIMNDMSRENLDHMLWGHYGSLFETG